MTAGRDKLLRFYKGTEGEETAIRLVDLAEQTVRTQKFRLSGFLDPYGAEIAETVAATYDGVTVQFDGGYLGAERQRAAFCHEDFGGRPDFAIAAVRAAWSGDFVRLTHRDVLGALMGLGVERDTIGDILVSAGSAKLLADKKMAAFLVEHLTSIGAASVEAALDDLENIASREERTKDIRATVASLRVDAVAAAGFGMSRSRAAADIDADKLKLNWQSVKNAAQSLKAGDVLSMRGRGRVEVVEIGGQTKKGRTGVLLRRFL
ncbi:MAG: RNA-binding protein [Schwartzia sp. (in: firmicutes)]